MTSSTLHQIRERGIQIVNAAVDLAARHLPAGNGRCPVCDANTRFSPNLTNTGIRGHARCPHCKALERHRLQAHVIDTTILPHFAGTSPRILHVAPEPSIAARLKPIASLYTTVDYAMPGVDLHVDLRDAKALPDASYDLVYASHVLEHIDDDAAAISEIHRILADGGLAVLPVPLVNRTTVEYPEPNPYEALHVRAPGPDYYERYRAIFARVDVITSDDVPEALHTYLHEDRSKWPTKTMPRRQAQPGRRHVDAVPLCWKQ